MRITPSLFYLFLCSISLTNAYAEPENIGNAPPSLSAGDKTAEKEARLLEDAMETQIDGKYPAMSRKASPPLGTLQSAWQKPQKTEGQVAPGIVRYSWSPSFVMPIRLRDYMTTTIQFPAWERITTFYLGDPYIFQVQQAAPNALVLRSQNAGADTNFTAIGSGGNLYNFYVRSESWNSHHISDFAIYVDAPTPNSYWQPASKTQEKPDHTSPSIRLEKPISMEVPDYIRSIVFKPENMQFDMRIYAKHADDASIAPERVWHDGVFTYFDYGTKADSVQRPVIYLVIDKVDTMVNTRSAGPNNQILIAEAVGNFTLRNGAKTICIKREKEHTAAASAILKKPDFASPKKMPQDTGVSSLHTPITSSTSPLPPYPPYKTRPIQ